MPDDSRKFIVNPYIAGSPVKDAAMFFGREDVYAWLRQHLRGKFQDNMIVLFGERRSGKTSILYQMNNKLGDERYVPVLLDLQGMSLEGLDGFLWEVARKIVLALRGVEGVPLLDRPVLREFEDDPGEQFEAVFLPPIIAALGERRLLLMFDEVERLEEKVLADELPKDVFTYLRSLVQQSSHTNFIFALGSRVETIRKEHSALFNLAVYRKISFLDLDYAEDLITRPIAKYCTYTRDAIDRILRLTAGQSYYTQLLCHNLFTRWTREKPEQLDVEDVEAVLPDVMEQGTPNLQFIWDDTSEVEHVVLAGLAQEAPKHQGGVLRRNLDAALRHEKLYPPDGDVINALRTLFERDVINDREPYEFRLGLVQLWLNKFNRLEWVREELGPIVREWQQLEEQRRREAPTRRERLMRWATPVLAVLLLFVIGVTVVVVRTSSSRQAALAAANTALAAKETERAEFEVDLAEASTKIVAAAAEGNRLAEETAQAEVAELETALARVTEELQVAAMEQATAVAAVGQVSNAPSATATATPAPTSTFTVIPPTNTPVLALATPTPAGPTGRLAIPVDNGANRYDVLIYAVPDGREIGSIPGARQPSFNDAGLLAVNAQGGVGETVRVYDANGTNGRAASPNPFDSHPSWSPDGTSLVYDNRELFAKDGEPVWRIFRQDGIIDPRASETERLDGDIFDQFSPLYPFWTADGQILFRACAYWAPGGQGQCGIWRTDASATTGRGGFSLPSRVTAQSEIPTDVYGGRVLAMGNRGDWEVYLGSIQGGDLINLSNNPASNDGLGTFSPDGKWIAFVSDRDGQWGVWYVPTSGGDPKSLPITGLRFGGGDRDWTTERVSWGP
jgi:Flp pilus assembly protein TadG